MTEIDLKQIKVKWDIENEFCIKNEPKLDTKFFFLEIEKQNYINHRYDERRMRINEINQYGYYLDKQSQPKQNYENEFCIGNEPKLDTKFFYLEIERQNYINRRYDEHQKLINEIDPCEYYLDSMIKAENELIEDYLNSYEIESESRINQLYEEYLIPANVDEIAIQFDDHYSYYMLENDNDDYSNIYLEISTIEYYEPYIEPFDDLDGIDYGDFEPKIQSNINYGDFQYILNELQSKERELFDKDIYKSEFDPELYYDRFVDKNDNEYYVPSDINSIVEDDIINEYKSLNEKIESDEYINELYEEYLNSINLDEFKY